MTWLSASWDSLVQAAAGGLVVLAMGGLAVRLCRQPARRARLIVLTIAGALAVPWLGAVGPALPIRIPAAAWRTAAQSATPAGPAATGGDRVPSESLAPDRLLTARVDILASGIDRSAAGDDGGPSRTIRRAPAAAVARFGEIPWRRLVLVGYATASAAVLAWWALGQALLWRVVRGARPAPRTVRERFIEISGPAGERVRLLISDRIALPFTYTWAHPTILLPEDLCSGDDEALGYALAHEWSHVERRDAWAWNLATVAGVVLFYQPLFWWLRRQLRLSQDYLADDRAASAGSPEDYAACLVRLAREGGRARGHAFGSALPVVGICDRPSSLSRRIAMLINDHGPIEHRCPRAWSLGSAAAAMLAILAVAGLRADATAAPDEPKPAAPKASTAPGRSEPKGETLHYTGRVKDKDTGKPIAGATVTVRRQDFIPKEGNRIIEESRHTTDADGKYSFAIPPEQVAVKRLYIELDVEHPDYATQAGFGYALSMIRKNEGLGERPFFENIALRPAKPVTGRVETPDGAPAEGVEILAYSRSGKPKVGEGFEYGSFARVKTDRAGRFRLPITTPGMGIFWILPRGFAPEAHVIPDAKRGDFGTFHLGKGVTITGRAFDAQGKPIAGMFVEIERDRASASESEALNQLIVSDAIERRAETDAEGRFNFDPLPAGIYSLKAVDYQHVPHKGLIRRPLPGVFAPMKVTIKDGETPEALALRAAPHVVIDGGWIDSQGKPKGGWDLMISGRIDGQFWHTQGQPGEDGKFSVQVPHGLENAQINISTNEHASARYRIGKDGKLSPDRHVMLGTLDHDVKDLEIIRYVAPIVIVKAVAKDGRELKDVVVSGDYTEENQGPGMRMILKNGVRSDVHFERQDDGRRRTTCLTPDREVNITAQADGFKPASRKFKLAEGKTEEVTLVLEPK